MFTGKSHANFETLIKWTRINFVIFIISVIIAAVIIVSLLLQQAFTKKNVTTINLTKNCKKNPET